MIRLHLSGDHPTSGDLLADVLRAVADDIALGARSGETVVEAWVGREVDFGRPIITDKGKTRYVDWSLTWD